ncbi:hypothetical protein DS2_12443 [Catenovulum agarivorans DS-2]|uniref:Uncharacterized protein n=1 Tax=Catenovulum agarivorans DS-2 TaxID=1328313 RepID=W7QBW4_9ALTE|nr:hypothetical protein DS2_12443 [Catenovulum agarivorans DS-2]
MLVRYLYIRNYKAHKNMFDKITSYIYPPDRLLASKVLKLKLTQVSIFGAGDLGRGVIQYLHDKPININRWYDSSVKQGKAYFCKREVWSIDNLSHEPCEYLIIASEVYKKEMITSARTAGFNGHFITL